MATVDPLLRLASMQGAAELLLRVGEPPALKGRNGLQPLSMPVMDDALVRHALRELVGESAIRAEGEGNYACATLGAVRVRWRTNEAARSPGRLEVTLTWTLDETRAPAPPIPMRLQVEAPPVIASEPVDRAILGSAVSTLLTRALTWAIGRGASDLVLTDGRPIAARVHGSMIRGEGVLHEGAVAAMLDGSLDGPRRARLAESGSTDLAIELTISGETRRFRVNRFHSLAGESAVLRPVSGTPPTLRSLHLPEALGKFAELSDGLVLVTGPAGSGKSTTLVAMIEHLNRSHARHVVTLEDPIEYVFAPERAVVHQREVGAHVASFAEGLRAALREAPDVILLGELRDPETIAAAVTAAETGHLVLATLHCGSCAASIDRIVDAFPEHQQRQVRHQLADVVRAIVSQRLLPARAGGRVPAVELLPMTSAIAHLIREGKGFQIPQSMQTGRESGMVPMARAIAELVRSGRVERAAALAAVVDPAAVIEALGG